MCDILWQCFHNVGAATEKALSPDIFFNLKEGWTYKNSFDLKWYGDFFFTETKFMIQVGASPWMALNITSNILNFILNLTGSQCSSCDTGVMWQ